MAGFRYLAAIRTHLLSDPAIASAVASRIYPMHLSSFAEPEYPCVTLWQKQGALSAVTFCPRMWNPAQVIIQVYSQKDIQEVFDISERITVMLHEKNQSISNGEVCFHEAKEIWANSGIYDKNTNAWQLSLLYRIRASLRNP